MSKLIYKRKIMSKLYVSQKWDRCYNLAINLRWMSDHDLREENEEMNYHRSSYMCVCERDSANIRLI